MEQYVSLSLQPLWDKYQFEENIGFGAYGSVKKVKNTEDYKYYAMKVQNLKDLMTQVPNNYSNEFLRIIREISTFKLCHPNITKFYESYFMPLIQYANGVIYQGEYDYITKQSDGRGRYIQSDGNVYDGFLKQDKRDGYGRSIFVEGDYHIGEYKDDKFHGQGRYYWKDGQIYEGQFVKDKKMDQDQ
ncbi:morn repeat protein [Stylonychia lemnae]|uniref:Morn repeat protein n=1 Tax=Stylonychia lemnae TaxID=5949 RepID=A0A078AIE6_STYLE|nr:morn repeat protein [Stylonychia lemnae]|eukprot:CDW80583.1 morn repeat protein [Stylonychia lemnae]